MGLFGKKKNQLLLTIPEMSCSHCEMKIQKLLGQLEEVQAVEADAGTRVATLTLKGEARPDAEAIAGALADSGYTVQPKS